MRGIALTAENLEALRASIREASPDGDSFVITVDDEAHPQLTPEEIRRRVDEVARGLLASVHKFKRRLSRGMLRVVNEAAAHVAPSIVARIRKLDAAG